MKAVELSGLEVGGIQKPEARRDTRDFRQSAQKEEKLMATTILGTAFHPLIAEPRPTTMGRILVIEDDGALRKILRRLFSSEGYEVDVVPDAVCGLERPRQGVPAAVVLDLRRPGSSGCDVCKKIANWIPGLPLVILSACLDVPRKVLLLEIGADDYVTIPFSPRELVAFYKQMHLDEESYTLSS
jgi:CheY-like chemotaxis protein